uniref:complement component receptor 1-like protein isoform X2 n=1 Tax=Monopterus albus TaxID=43700 RepID=UPI0009B4D6DD|nr:complement component receptor 1-like protein isoform X2 [Monopterus albus]
MAITYVFLLSSLGLVITQAQDCSRPVPGPNMDLKGNDINLNTFPSGTTVSFACNVGYTSKGGSPSITCTNGNWSAVKLECERKNCGALTEVTNGQIDYPDGTQFGDKAVVTCNTGYIPVGGTNVICMDGGWSGRLPDCEVVTCAKPPAIENGDYSPKEDVYSYREVVMYSCQAGYTLGGSRSRTCSEDGSFKPEAPTCYVPVPCKEPLIDNGGWMSGARPPYTEKSTVTLECNPGYIMRGTSTQTCENGSWAPGLPICERVVQCEVPHVANGVLSGGAQPPYTEKSTVTLQCNTGYVMKGSSTQICDKNGRWSPGLPVCEGVEGPPEKDPHNNAVAWGVGITLIVLMVHYNWM